MLLATAVAFVGSKRVPDPFGPAANGLIAGARNGDIYVYNAVDGTEKLLVGGDNADVGPVFSRDGTRIAFLRLDPVDEDRATLFLVAPDGSGLRALFGPESVQSGAWSPSSDRLAVITGMQTDRALWIVPADGPPPSRPLDLGDVMPSTEVIWRPPDGRELVFTGVEDGQFDSSWRRPMDRLRRVASSPARRGS